MFLYSTTIKTRIWFQTPFFFFLMDDQSHSTKLQTCKAQKFRILVQMHKVIDNVVFNQRQALCSTLHSEPNPFKHLLAYRCLGSNGIWSNASWPDQWNRSLLLFDVLEKATQGGKWSSYANLQFCTSTDSLAEVFRQLLL